MLAPQVKTSLFWNTGRENFVCRWSQPSWSVSVEYWQGQWAESVWTICSSFKHIEVFQTGRGVLIAKSAGWDYKKWTELLWDAYQVEHDILSSRLLHIKLNCTVKILRSRWTFCKAHRQQESDINRIIHLTHLLFRREWTAVDQHRHGA